ncbi:hypothetical protein SUGI_0960420 [Cryptomeria japonica]|nr:hypothetical protein SUGI_0960420 [Cryptomeria japonica]
MEVNFDLKASKQHMAFWGKITIERLKIIFTTVDPFFLIQGLDALLEWVELGRGFITCLGDWVVVPSYPLHVDPFILWRAMEDRNVRRHEVIEGWQAVRDYVTDWEIVLCLQSVM